MYSTIAIHQISDFFDGVARFRLKNVAERICLSVVSLADLTLKDLLVIHVDFQKLPCW